ncbi:MAG: hypothetical protein DLM55_10115 [Acidimicrobiales bacterium]|nr:MAG: hypothetical protein DLM55_10115 [Acidimicrobiales bacterium]
MRFEIFDVVIVGAGSAGGVLAARLSEDPSRSVLLLEAGPDFGSFPATQPPEIADAYNPSATSYDWGYSGKALRLGRSLPLYAGRIVGGSSATNNVMALRGHPSDYDRWAQYGCTGWSFQDVLPAFCRLERDEDFDDEWHGTSGPIPVRRYAELTQVQQAFLDASAITGHTLIADHNAPGAIGAGRLPVNEAAGVRQSTALTYLAAARERPNLTIRAGQRVDRIVFSAARASAVRLAGTGEEIAAGHVMLAAGAYGSPAILLRSGIGPAEQLGELGIPVTQDLPGVGRNLHDHPLLRLPFEAHGEPESVLHQTVLTATTDSPRGVRGPDLQVFPSGISSGGDGLTLTLLVALLQPYSRGKLRLSSPDPAAALRIEPGHFSHPEDLSRLLAGVRLAREIAATSPLVDHLADERWPGAGVTDERELSAVVLAEVATYHHPVGTCRMGLDHDPKAVVDETSHVHGVDRLSVVDASIMPTIPSANTNLPTLMLAERMSEYT